MGRVRWVGLLVILVLVIYSGHVDAENWPQFRGQGGSGVSASTVKLPVKIGPEKAGTESSLQWKIAIAKGHSSPVIFKDRVYLTAVRDRKLLTVAVDANTGRQLWERESKYQKLESIHRIGSRATSSVTTDREVVISFFGSSGMSAFTTAGNPLWHRSMGPFHNQFGATSSPILVGDKIVTVQDHDTHSFLAVFDKKTGKDIWRVERPNFRRNYCSPVLWTVNGKTQIVVPGSSQLMGYDLATGELLWTVRGICRVVSNTPVVGDDGRLYIASTGGGAAPPQPSFADLLKQADKNKNGKLEKGELPKSPIKSFFSQFDRDMNGALNLEEYESIREIFRISRSVAMAIKPGGRGDITKTHVAWTSSRGIPRNSSPLYYRGKLFLVRDGGVMAVLDAKTGNTVQQIRLAGRGKYFSSAIAGDGKVYVVDDRGTVSVLSVGKTAKLVHNARFGEAVLATPAIANGRIYLRTEKTLFCFAVK